jgi:hypothetical protein
LQNAAFWRPKGKKLSSAITALSVGQPCRLLSEILCAETAPLSLLHSAFLKMPFMERWTGHGPIFDDDLVAREKIRVAPPFRQAKPACDEIR